MIRKQLDVVWLEGNPYWRLRLWVFGILVYTRCTIDETLRTADLYIYEERHAAL